MRVQLQMMKTNFVDQGYPVVIGEFGANWRDLSKLSGESQEKHNASIKAHYREMHRLCKEMGGMVPMTWDTNSLSQEGSKGCMTIVDRKNLKVFNPYAMEGINEIYPRPSEMGMGIPVQKANRYARTVYRVNGQQLNGKSLSPGLYVSDGEKFVVGRLY